MSESESRTIALNALAEPLPAVVVAAYGRDKLEYGPDHTSPQSVRSTSHRDDPARRCVSCDGVVRGSWPDCGPRYLRLFL